MQPGVEAAERAQEETRLFARYYTEPKKKGAKSSKPDELVADIDAAQKLLKNPPALSAHQRWDTPALVAAAALETHLLHGVDLPGDALAFAADTVLRIGEGEAWPRQCESEMTYFEQAVDRSAARALPLLLLPAAAPLRSIVDETGGRATFERAAAAGLNLAQAVASEVRLHLARGLDHLWKTPCTNDRRCHHELGALLATETMRDCVLGDRDPDTGQRSAVTLDEPVAESLHNTPDDLIRTFRLDAAIRALAPAATSGICVSTRAHAMLLALLAAQRRSLLANEDNIDYRGTHALVSARALLALAQDGNDSATSAHIDAYADNSALLGNLLRALSAAAEETPERAATARQAWPNVIRRVLHLNDSGRTPFQDPSLGEMTLAALIPTATPEIGYLYREVQNTPIIWWDPLALRTEVEAWLEPAAGNAICVEQLISFLCGLALEDQARTGLPWVATLVLADPDRVARRASMPTTWLIEIRSAAASSLEAEWQQVVDALVIAGVTRLAPYSE